MRVSRPIGSSSVVMNANAARDSTTSAALALRGETSGISHPSRSHRIVAPSAVAHDPDVMAGRHTGPGHR